MNPVAERAQNLSVCRIFLGIDRRLVLSTGERDIAGKLLARMISTISSRGQQAILPSLVGQSPFQPNVTGGKQTKLVFGLDMDGATLPTAFWVFT